MNYLVISGVLGVILGVFSVCRQRAFIGLLLLSVPAGIFFLQLGGPTFLVYGAAEAQGIKGLWTILKKLFDLLPKDVQLGLVIFPAFFLAARLLAWLQINFWASEEPVKVRRKRILKEYGYKDGMPH